MASKRAPKIAAVRDAGDQAVREPLPSLPVAQVLSFVKETKGRATWSTRELAQSLNIGIPEARRVTALLQAQGYIEPAGHDNWMTTLAGETVSGSKTPRFAPETIEAGLSRLADRIRAVNRDPKAPFRVVKAIAFGDFLSAEPRVQAADVGLQLVAQTPEPKEANSAVEQAAERKFFRQLKGASPTLNIRAYEDWMGRRNHRKLL